MNRTYISELAGQLNIETDRHFGKTVIEELLTRVNERGLLADPPNPRQVVPPDAGVRFTAKPEPRSPHIDFVTLADGGILCTDQRMLTGQIWDRYAFEASFTVTGVIQA